MSRLPVSGSTFVAAQRSVRLMNSSFTGPSCSGLPLQSNSAHGSSPVDDDVGPEAQRVHRAADDALQLAQRRQIDDVQAFGGDVREAVAGREDDAGGAAQLVLHVGGEELLDHFAANGRAQVAARHLLAVAQNRQRLGRVVKARLQRRQALVAHQHEEVDLRQVRRLARDRSAPGPFSTA